MWIRSQDKKILINCLGVRLYKNRHVPLPFILCAIPEPADFELGGYETEEAALAELGAIEQWINTECKGAYQVSGG